MLIKYALCIGKPWSEVKKSNRWLCTKENGEKDSLRKTKTHKLFYGRKYELIVQRVIGK